MKCKNEGCEKETVNSDYCDSCWESYADETFGIEEDENNKTTT